MYKKALKIKLYLAWCFQDRKKENAPKFSGMENDIKIAMLLKTDQQFALFRNFLFVHFPRKNI